MFIQNGVKRPENDNYNTHHNTRKYAFIPKTMHGDRLYDFN